MRISDFLCTFIPMKEQVTDISKVLQDMTEEMRSLRETVNQQYAEIIKLNLYAVKQKCTTANVVIYAVVSFFYFQKFFCCLNSAALFLVRYFYILK